MCDVGVCVESVRCLGALCKLPGLVASHLCALLAPIPQEAERWRREAEALGVKRDEMREETEVRIPGTRVRTLSLSDALTQFLYSLSHIL